VGKTVVLGVHLGGSDLQIPVVPFGLEPTKMLLRGLESSARIIESGGRRIGYVHVWCYAGYTYQHALEVLLSQGVLKDADALIWDLRDGWGGAQPEYLDLFNARALTMQVTDRSGNSEFVNVKWRTPVAMSDSLRVRASRSMLALNQCPDSGLVEARRSACRGAECRRGVDQRHAACGKQRRQHGAVIELTVLVFDHGAERKTNRDHGCNEKNPDLDRTRLQEAQAVTE